MNERRGPTTRIPACFLPDRVGLRTLLMAIDWRPLSRSGIETFHNERIAEKYEGW